LAHSREEVAVGEADAAAAHPIHAVENEDSLNSRWSPTTRSSISCSTSSRNFHNVDVDTMRSDERWEW
jgi:hypothetical protein